MKSSTLHLAVNSRLAQFLKSYLLQGAFDSALAVITPNVMTWQQVLNDWQAEQMLLGNLPIADLPSKVLSSFEAQLVWEDLLDNNKSVSALLNKNDMAKTLYQAWLLWAEYLNYDLLQAQFKSEELSLFLQLKKQYIDFLQQNNFWDSSLKIQQQLDWFKTTTPEFSEIKLYGFDEVTPYLQSWLDGLQDKGVVINFVEQFYLTRQDEMQLCIAKSNVDEAQQAALWAYDLVAQGHKNIAIVAPNIDEVQHNLSWALDELMWTNKQYSLQSLQKNWQGSPLYNISLGQPLVSFSLVKHALQLVKVMLSGHKKIDYDVFSKWLVSPYTTGDLITRQKLDFNLRRWQWAKLSINNVVERMQQESCRDSFSKHLYANLSVSLKEIGGGVVSSAEFIGQLFSLFTNMHWAEKVGNRSLTSHEFQQKEALFSALDIFKNNIFPQNQQSPMQWLKLLEKFLGEQMFQPKNMGASPIQIMGMLEAGGQQFDGLWVMGMTGESWPREAKPNPFLPIGLQREHKVPRADASRELAYAKTLTQRLAKASANTVWSYASFIDSREQLQSPILNQYQKQFVSYQQQPYLTLAEQSFKRAKPLEKAVDNKAPAIAEGTLMMGGAGFITAQAVCPLMAFLDYRLGAKSKLEKVEEGLQQNNFGILVHRVLERFWQEVKTQANLLVDDKLEEKLNTIITQELELVQESYQELFLKIEHKRVLNLITEWLELEKTCPSFEVVKFEQDYDLNIAGLIFNIKIDRVDKVAEGHVIVDYKTGKASINELSKEPLVTPQLAVYLHADIDNVVGLGYGLINSDDGIKLSVLPKNKEIVVQENWDETIHSLKQQVTNIVTGIKNGNAELSFQKEEQLKYAGCLLALRIPEASDYLDDIT